jgi:hypothetical protein
LVLLASDAGAQQSTAGGADRGALRFRPLLVCLYALAGVVLFGIAAPPSSRAATDPSRRSADVSVAPPAAAQTATDRPARAPHRPHVLHRRSHKNAPGHADSVLPGETDNDDGTSRDPDDDDDTTNDLSVNDDSDVPAIAWCHTSACYRIGLEACSRSPSWEAPSALFPGFKRLRC